MIVVVSKQTLGFCFGDVDFVDLRQDLSVGTGESSSCSLLILLSELE
jgi:hypothetical protein